MGAITSEAEGQGCEAGLSPEARRSQRRALAWVIAWAVAFLGATLLLNADLGLPAAANWSLAVVPSLLGVAMLGAYFLFLRASDELQRRIQMEALALGFGVGVVAMNGYRLLERAGAPAIDVNDIGVVMMLAFAVGVFLGQRRYS